MWIDTHCHLDAGEFAADTDAVRQRARAAGVLHCVLPAVLPANFDAVRELAHRHGDSYALGIHPLCTGDAADADLEVLDGALAAASSPASSPPRPVPACCGRPSCCWPPRWAPAC